MKRTTRGLLALTLVAGVALAAILRPAGAEEKAKTQAGFVHTVIITLKKDAPKNVEAEIVADCHAMLAKIPSVRHLRAGRPSEKGTPKLARTDYTLGLMILFDDAEGLKVYDEHPLHKEFVTKYLPHVELDKLFVYDFANQER